MTFTERPTKLEAFLGLLRQGLVSIHFDARKPGVIVPPQCANDPHTIFQYGIAMPIPIPDLVMNETGVRATLSFSRQPHPTFVPWSAVYVVACSATGSGVLYREDVPADVPLETGHPDDPPKPARPALTSVPSNADDGSDDGPPQPRGPVKLSLVK